MSFSAINNSDTGLSVRTTLNNIITYLNRLGFDLQFSDNNVDWHYPWVSGDLYVRFSDDYGSTWTDGIYLLYSAASSWDSVVFDTANGNLNLYKGAVLDFTENLDGRYALTSAAKQVIYKITLPVNGTLSGSVAAAVEGTDYPTGWVLAASGGNLQINHGLTRYAMNARVKYNVSGNQYRHLKDFENGYSGLLDVDSDNLTIEGISTFYTAYKLQILISFE